MRLAGAGIGGLSGAGGGTGAGALLKRTRQLTR